MNKTFKKISSLLITVLILILTTTLLLSAGGGTNPFTGFNNENFNVSGNWTLDNADISGGVLTFTDEVGTATYLLDISSQSTYIDSGQLQFAFCAEAFIANELNPDSAKINISFLDSSSGVLSSALLERGDLNQDDFINLVENGFIPINTTSIKFEFTAQNYDDSNSVQFKGFSFVVTEDIAPDINLDFDYDEEWFSPTVKVKVNASDDQSGIAGIYNAVNNGLLISDSLYEESIDQNYSGYFYAIDNAGNQSSIISAHVIDEDDFLDLYLPNGMTFTNLAGGNSNGTIQELGTNRIKYTPQANFSGLETFSFDYSWNSTTGTIEAFIFVRNINDAPVANDDYVEIQEDEPILIDVLANDTDADIGNVLNEKIIIDSFTQPLNGTVTKVDDKLYFVPDQDWFGSTNFEYTIKDTKDATSSATVHIVVHPVNDEPEFVNLDESYTFDEDSGTHSIVFFVEDVETAAKDLMLQLKTTQDVVTIDSLTGIGSANGEITLTFSTKQDVFGEAVLQLHLSDGLATTIKPVTIVIENVNDEPPAMNFTLQYVEDTPLIIDFNDLLFGKKDVDGDDISFAEIITYPYSDSSYLVEQSPGVYLFIPKEDDFDEITFTYRVTDNQVGATGTISTITLIGEPVNDKPVIKFRSGK